MPINKNTLYLFFVLTLTLSLSKNVKAQDNDEKFVVVIDAGHGGKDPGRPTKFGYKEKDIALRVALNVGKALEKLPEFKVIYTRKTDVFVELKKRASIANKADADLFVSIHCNAHNSNAYGTETYVLGAKNTERNMHVAQAENEVIFLEDNYEKSYGGFDPSSPESSIAISLEQEVYIQQSVILAKNIETNFSKKLKRKSRGLKQASLLVIRSTYMPSVLVETGFITNKREGDYLNSIKGNNEISNAIFEAIVAYKKELEENVGTDVIPKKDKDSHILTQTKYDKNNYNAKDKINKTTTSKSKDKKETSNNAIVENESNKVIKKADKTPTKPIINKEKNTEVVSVETSKKIEQKTEQTNLNNDAENDGIVFKVQISASKSKINPEIFYSKGINDLSQTHTDEYYRYFTGNTKNYNEIKQHRIRTKAKGFSDCYIVALNGEEKIPVKQALKLLSKHN